MEGNEALPDAPEDIFMEDIPPQPPPQHPHPILLVNPSPSPSPPAQPLLFDVWEEYSGDLGSFQRCGEGRGQVDDTILLGGGGQEAHTPG